MTTLKERLQMEMPPPPKRSVMFAVSGDEDDHEENTSVTSSTLSQTANNNYNSSSAIGISPTTTLTHLQYKWPGQTGNGKHLDVRPMSFDSLLSSGHNIVIPLFQRRYCWTSVQIEQWWKDVYNNNEGQHSTHKTMFKKSYDDATGGTTLICIDGQQRLTTTTLLLIALRAEARRQTDIDASSLVRKIDAVLLPNDNAIAGMKRWAKYQAFQLIRNNECHHQDNKTTYSFTMPSLPSGWLPPFDTILTPSYIDRIAYFELLCKDHVLAALEEAINTNTNTNNNNTPIQIELNSSAICCQESVQCMAFDIFVYKMRQLTLATERNRIVSTLNKLYHNQLVGFSLMYIEMLTDDNVQHIFLWMQEKSVFGMGTLLHNEHPGIDFTPIDLARNLVVSSVMNEALEEQVKFYEHCWIDPLEKQFGTTCVSRILYHLVDSIPPEGRYVGDMEQRLEMWKAATPTLMQGAFSLDKPMMIYARFHSHVQQRAMKLEDGDPHAITKKVADSIVQEMVTVGKLMGL